MKLLEFAKELERPIEEKELPTLIKGVVLGSALRNVTNGITYVEKWTYNDLILMAGLLLLHGRSFDGAPKTISWSEDIEELLCHELMSLKELVRNEESLIKEAADPGE